MSELITVIVRVNDECRDFEGHEDFEIDIAGATSVSDLTDLVNAEWSDFVSDNEDALTVAGADISDLEDDEYDVTDTDLPSGLDWLCKNGEGIDNKDDWEWDWIEYFGQSDTKEADVVYSAWSLNISPENIDEAYAGSWDSDADFAQDYAEQTGAVNSEVSWPYSCIDWDWASREIMMDFSEYNYHYFRSM